MLLSSKVECNPAYGYLRQQGGLIWARELGFGPKILWQVGTGLNLHLYGDNSSLIGPEEISISQKTDAGNTMGMQPARATWTQLSAQD